MSLVSIVLAAMTAWIPPAEHRHLEPARVTAARYESIARTIAEVVVATHGDRIDGSAGFEALLLASVAAAESHYAARVDDCRVGLGGAWSLWQITRPRRDVCRSRARAAGIALQMIRTSWKACAALPVADRLSWYTDGVCHARWWRSRSRVERTLELWKTLDGATPPPPPFAVVTIG